MMLITIITGVGIGQAVQCLDCGLDDRGSIPGTGRDFLSSPPRPDWLWGSSSFLSNGYRG